MFQYNLWFASHTSLTVIPGRCPAIFLHFCRNLCMGLTEIATHGILYQIKKRSMGSVLLHLVYESRSRTCGLSFFLWFLVCYDFFSRWVVDQINHVRRIGGEWGGLLTPQTPQRARILPRSGNGLEKNQTQTPYFFLSRSLNLIGGPNVELFEAKA